MLLNLSALFSVIALSGIVQVLSVNVGSPSFLARSSFFCSHDDAANLCNELFDVGSCEGADSNYLPYCGTYYDNQVLLQECQELGTAFPAAIGVTWFDYLDDMSPGTICYVVFPSGTDLETVCADTTIFDPDDIGGSSTSTTISGTDGSLDADCYECVRP